METPTGTETPSRDDSIIEHPMNGHHVDVEDDLDKEDLSPPPDTPISATPVSPTPASISPIAEPMSRTPSLPVNALEDEIVVGTNAKQLAIAAQKIAKTEDVDMDDVEIESVVSTKRKRVSDDDEEFASPAPRTGLPDSRPRSVRPVKAFATNYAKEDVLLGYWRESSVPEIKDKHAVRGFIDSKDRLRTRIQPCSRFGRNLSVEYPLPPGPGGSWVTFQQVAFERHLQNLNQNQVKEYVRARSKTQKPGETTEEQEKGDREAVEEAIRVCQEKGPSLTGAQEPLVAYGTDIPEHANLHSRPGPKKRRAYGSYGASNSESPAASRPPPLDDLPGSRPTRILIGYWKASSSKDPADKHAVYGVLGANDMFRVKLTRKTRDGRALVGNFPQGAGALWISWDEVVFEPHLRQLTRPEIKEYCRVRQCQIDEGETAADRVDNETKAVYEAQKRVATGLPTAPTKRGEHPAVPVALAMKTPTNGHAYGGESHDDQHQAATTPPDAFESRPPPRQGPQPPRARTSLPNVELRAANRPPPPSAAERTNDLARREIARIEAAQARAEQRAQTRESYISSATVPSSSSTGEVSANKAMFDDNRSRLNRVWAAQEASRLRAGTEDAIMVEGIKFERKQSGPFEGKLASQGSIISVDGEDYVMYRVLTKPTFF
ncbi:hypothetical protein QBC47DRAFT_397406 [Echria macrotheca]|uniref:Uncharacterized protein n=1 Tax=Echria macrotheca TaxID=438768 RepID=A0AAJ0BN99_9PEZI|nr:hypothetical protein QBC47DRAFT_397406 [Echria macrotheca]